MDYKEISVSLHSDDTIVEFDLKANKVVDEKDFIEKMSTFLELIGYTKYKEIIFTNVSPFFTISKSCRDYARCHVIEAMKNYCVDKIYFEIPKDIDPMQVNKFDYDVTAITDKNEIIRNRIKDKNTLN